MVCQLLTILLYGLLAAVIAYLLGSISFSILFTRLFDHKKDIRTMGSGNAGATNVLRSVGAKAAAFTFVFDFAKGIVSVWIGRTIFEYAASVISVPGISSWELVQYGAYISGFFCVMGHIFPLYFGFKGGKGVLTSWAIIALIDWRAFLFVIVVFIIAFLFSKIVSLASICAAISFPIFSLILNSMAVFSQGTGDGPNSPFYAVSTFIIASLQAGILVYKHKSNIQRLRAGEEKKLTIKKKEK